MGPDVDRLLLHVGPVRAVRDDFPIALVSPSLGGARLHRTISGTEHRINKIIIEQFTLVETAVKVSQFCETMLWIFGNSWSAPGP